MERTILFLSIILMNACSADKTEKEAAVLLNGKQLPQKWELVAMSGMVANVPPTKGDEMEWQEYYMLGADGTFTKSRKQAGKVTEATGRYEIQELADGKYLQLTYGSDHELIGNCSDEPKELLMFDTENTLTGTWWACDGPGLFYKRSE